MTSRGRLLKNHKRLCLKARALMQLKNRDYAHADDPFKNFRRHGLYGITVRISDKLARLDNFIENGKFSVKDEKIEDTVMDLMNYSVLFYSLLEDERGKKTAK